MSFELVCKKCSQTKIPSPNHDPNRKNQLGSSNQHELCIHSFIHPFIHSFSIYSESGTEIRNMNVFFHLLPHTYLRNKEIKTVTDKLLDQVHKAKKYRAGSPGQDHPATFILLEIDAYILIGFSIIKLMHFP